MFTLLVTEERPRGIKGLWNRMFCSRPRLEQHYTMDIPWRLIRAPVGKNGPDWNRIERLADRHAVRLVSSTHHQPPQNSQVRMAGLMGFQRIMAARTICHLLEKYSCSGTIGVIDPRARCLSAVEILLERAGCVMVYTQLPHRYEWFANRMLQQKGAPVVLCSTPEMFADCSWVLLGGLCDNWSDWVGKDTLVFSAAGKVAETDNLVCCYEPECPPQLWEQIPKGVPPADLCSALYQFAGCYQLSKLLPQNCLIGGRLTEIKDLSPKYGPKSPNDRS